jgi:hypothetical protein
MITLDSASIVRREIFMFGAVYTCLVRCIGN